MTKFKFIRGLIWFIRGLIWAVCMTLFAYLLGIEWNLRILALCLLSGLVDAVVYADYSEVLKKSEGSK